MRLMFSSWPKFLVILLVASLQCFAPLIHAHTNSTPHDHVIHVHSDATSASAAIDVVDVDHQHGEAIGVAKEYKRDYSLLLFAAALLAAMWALPATRLVIRVFYQRYSLPPRRHSPPSPQAP